MRLVDTLLPAKLCTRSKWVADRLKQRGYVRYGAGDGWIVLAYAGPQNRDTYGPCNLQATIRDDSLNVTAAFRYTFAQDIHVTRHLYLSQKDWSLLEAFESFFLAERDRDFMDILSVSTSG